MPLDWRVPPAGRFRQSGSAKHKIGVVLNYGRAASLGRNEKKETREKFHLPLAVKGTTSFTLHYAVACTLQYNYIASIHVYTES